MKSAKGLLNMLAVGVVAMGVGFAAPTAMAQAQPAQPAHKEGEKHDKKHDDKKKEEKKQDDKKKVEAPKVGEMAPDFTLKGADGKEYKLSELTKSGKIVVLQWFNPDCPFVKKHYDNGATTFNAMNTSWKDKNVVLIGINSGAAGKQGAGLDRTKKAIADWKIEYPVLLDDSGTVGKAFGAKHTPEMVVVNKDGYVAYRGAIDDDAGEKPGKTNYVAKAVSELLEGKKVTTSETKAYGCPVKY